MTLQVHLIVQNSADFNDPTFSGAIEENVTAASAVSCDVERAEAWHDLVAISRSGYIGALRQLAYRLDQRIAIHRGLPRAEILCCPLEDVCKIHFSNSAEANAPSPGNHEMSFARA